MTRRNAVGVWNGPNGIVIHWRCNCGHEGLQDRLGSHPMPADPARTPDLPVLGAG